MKQNQRLYLPAFTLAASIILAAWIIAHTAFSIKSFERTVTVKGLAEMEVTADTVIWPITFVLAGNDLNQLYQDLDAKNKLITEFLTQQGISDSDITAAPPKVVDKSAQNWGGNNQAAFRYSAQQSITVFSHDIEKTQHVISNVSQLGKNGIVLSGDNYESKTEYLFTQLNQYKPEMIQQATKNARQSAEKFAQDSQSHLGKIKRASQGQFSINSRDKNNPHIKKIRVVSTVEYYLAD